MFGYHRHVLCFFSESQTENKAMIGIIMIIVASLGRTIAVTKIGRALIVKLWGRHEQCCMQGPSETARSWAPGRWDALAYAWQPGRGGAAVVNPAGPHFRAAAAGDGHPR
jgi:hypothetical protein